MRNVIFAINAALDGCVDHTKQIVDEETLEYFTHLMRDADLQVLGRKTYQLMVPYRPDVAKASPRRKQTKNLLEHLTPSTKLFFQSLDVGQGRGQKYENGSHEPSRRNT